MQHDLRWRLAVCNVSLWVCALRIVAVVVSGD